MLFRTRLTTAFLAIAAVCALAAPSAFASGSQVTIMQDNNAINANPLAALSKMRQMGATQVKYAIYWQYVSPDPGSTRAPAGRATDPNIYLPQFGQLIAIDNAARAVGIKLGFMVTAPAPRWAEGGGCSGQEESAGTCKPSAADFGAFMTALGRTFGGATPGVPAVRWWSIWNEPNYIPNLAPQLIGSSVYEAADLYRGLLNAGWNGLRASGHTPSSDTILFGEVAPRGISGGNARGGGPEFNGAGSKPVAFLAALYCETAAGRRFSAKLAAENGCGPAAAFRRDNPALFSASGVADHPYSQGVAPNTRTGDCRLGRQNLFCPASRSHPADPLWTDLASISNLENGLARDVRAYGASTRFAIWNTEYGYWTTPPGRDACTRSLPAECDLSQAMAAYYLNWSEYISYLNPQIMSIAQYQLYDPSTGGWTDGLLTRSGAPKAGFYAYELPLFLPTTVAQHPANLTVWGGVRQASVDAARAPGLTPTVAIQFRGASGGWRTLRTLAVNTHSPGGYFSTPVRFSTSGSVRLAYTEGASTITSRVQTITIR